MSNLQDKPFVPRDNTFLAVAAGATGVMLEQSAQEYMADNPRTAGSATVTVAGSFSDGDTGQITISNGLLPNGSKAFQLTAASDTATTLAAKFAAAINNDSAMQALGIYATSLAGVVTIKHPGPVATKTTITVAVTGGVTLTRSPVGGGMTGGAGPIIPTSDFSNVYNGQIVSFRAFRPEIVQADQLTTLVSEACPIY